MGQSEELKDKIKGLAEVVNSFKSDPVQVRVLEILLRGVSPECRLNPMRMALAVGFFVVGLILGLFVLQRYGFLLESTLVVPSHFHRFLWSAGSAFTGFGVLAFIFRTSPEPAFLKYVTYYLPLLLVMAALVTGITYLIMQLNGAAFFYFAFGVSFLLGFLIDSLDGIVRSVIDRYGSS